MKQLTLSAKILDQYGLPLAGKPEFFIEPSGEKKPVYDKNGRQNRLDLTLADLLAEQFVNGQVSATDILDDEKCFAWSKELDATGVVTLEDEDILAIGGFIEHLTLTRIARYRVRAIWKEAVDNAQTLVETNIS